MSAVFAAMGLLRDAFRVGGEPEPRDFGERLGDVGFFVKTGIGRTMATGLTAVGEIEPCEPSSEDTPLLTEALYSDSRADSELGEFMGCDMSTKLPKEFLGLGSGSEYDDSERLRL